MSFIPEYGCVFCRSGKEEVVAEYLIQVHPGLKAVVPKKIRYRRSHGIATEEWIKLFPGYVFFSHASDLRMDIVIQNMYIIRILTSDNGDWRLHGSDKEIAHQLVLIDGRIGFSKAYYEGDMVKISEGFLKQYEGSIIRVNHRAKTAQINVNFDGKCLSIWAGFELINKLVERS